MNHSTTPVFTLFQHEPENAKKHSTSNRVSTTLDASVQRHQVVVDGNSADTVSISGGGFTQAGTVMHDSVTYTVYDSAIDHAQLLINAAVQVNGLVLG